jgi:LEA14-like dessication related protein
VSAANQVVDTTKSPTTFIDTTANGVDLINIANPNSVGVSVNHYTTAITIKAIRIGNHHGCILAKHF